MFYLSTMGLVYILKCRSTFRLRYVTDNGRSAGPPNILQKDVVMGGVRGLYNISETHHSKIYNSLYTVAL